MKVKFENIPDPLHIMEILADLLEDESGGEYVYEVFRDGMPIEREDCDRVEKAEKEEMEIAK